MTRSEQFEAAWTRLSRTVNNRTLLKEVAELFYLKGFMDGKTDGMKPTLSPQEEAKLANATIGERFNHEHYGQVLEAQKHQ
jgi:hypothetical protein